LHKEKKTIKANNISNACLIAMGFELVKDPLQEEHNYNIKTGKTIKRVCDPLKS
jgi:hypothetical protein